MLSVSCTECTIPVPDEDKLTTPTYACYGCQMSYLLRYFAGPESAPAGIPVRDDTPDDTLQAVMTATEASESLYLQPDEWLQTSGTLQAPERRTLEAPETTATSTTTPVAAASLTVTSPRFIPRPSVERSERAEPQQQMTVAWADTRQSSFKHTDRLRPEGEPGAMTATTPRRSSIARLEDTRWRRSSTALAAAAGNALLLERINDLDARLARPSVSMPSFFMGLRICS